MDKRLYALRHTLNQISVSGENNLNMLLACIQTINTIINEAESKEAKNNEQDQT